MGACFSAEDKERERSARIDRVIEEDAKRLKKECKILLLGIYLYIFSIFFEHVILTWRAQRLW